MDSKRAERIAGATVAWYRANARDLPWRRAPFRHDPYSVYVSEVMLQQTQVRTVIPYWERWMRLFPTIESLAEAEAEQVLKAWEGLGYYRRARYLQRAARLVVERFGGIFPSAFEEVLDLPGVGRYTAGAVCSIAFGQAVPVLDGNVVRVLSRVRLLGREAGLWEAAGELVRAGGNPADLNQGLMELGATICVPREPLCAQCPVNAFCAAFEQGRIGEFPKAKVRAKARKRRFVAVVVRHGDAVLVRRRAAEAVNGALWEFPNFEIGPRDGIRRRLGEYLACAPEFETLATIRHTITHNRITLHALGVRLAGRRIAERLQARWAKLPELELLPLSSAHAKLRKLVLERS